MFKVTKLLPVFLLGLAMAGCSTTKITNLTPPRQARNNNDSYMVEAAFTSDQQALRWESIRAQVLVGTEAIPMRFTPHMTNRWETLIPGRGGNLIYYRFKFDYSVNSFGKPQGQTKLSPIYQLQIVDR